MSNNVLISVVIPIYNGKATIIRCLDSIYRGVTSPESSFEIIVVDDCSSDLSCKIVEKYSSRHTNLILLRQKENKRQGAARNRGLAVAKGTYIVFLDADDELGAGIMEAIKYAVSEKPDMLLCNIDFKSNNGNISKCEKPNIAPKSPISGVEFANNYYDMGNISGYFCAYLYKKSFLEQTDIPFIEGRRHEDADWCEKHLWKAQTVAFIDTPIYLYYHNPMSTMHTFSSDGDADKIMMCYRRLLFAKTIGNCKYSAVITKHCIEWINAVFSYRHMSRHSYGSCSQLFSRIDKEAFCYLREKKLKGFPGICIRHRIITIIILTASFPLIKILRQQYHRLYGQNSY